MSSTAATRRSARSSDPAPHRDAEPVPRAASATPTGPWRGAAPATPAPQRPAQSVRRDDRRIDLVTVVHIHQHRRGPYRVRAVAFLTALTALALAVWTPQMLAGSHSGAVGLIAGIAAAVYFIGLGANATVLYQLPMDTRHRSWSRPATPMCALRAAGCGGWSCCPLVSRSEAGGRTRHRRRRVTGGCSHSGSFPRSGIHEAEVLGQQDHKTIRAGTSGWATRDHVHLCLQIVGVSSRAGVCGLAGPRRDASELAGDEREVGQAARPVHGGGCAAGRDVLPGCGRAGTAVQPGRRQRGHRIDRSGGRAVAGGHHGHRLRRHAHRLPVRPVPGAGGGGGHLGGDEGRDRGE